MLQRRNGANPQDANYKPTRSQEFIRSEAEMLIKRESQFKSAWPSDPIQIAEMGAFAFEAGDTSNPFTYSRTREDGLTLYFKRNFCRLLPQKAPKGSLPTILAHMKTLNAAITVDEIVKGADETEEWRIAFYHKLHGTSPDALADDAQAAGLPAAEQDRVATDRRVGVVTEVEGRRRDGLDNEATDYLSTLQTQNAESFARLVDGHHWPELRQLQRKHGLGDDDVLRFLKESGPNGEALQRTWMIHERRSEMTLAYLRKVRFALTTSNQHWFVKLLCECVGFEDVDMPYHAMKRSYAERDGYKRARLQVAIIRHFRLVFKNLTMLQKCCEVVVPDGHKQIASRILYLKRSVG